MKLRTFLILGLTLFSSLTAVEDFYVRKRDAFSTAFDIETHDRKLGSVYRQIFSYPPTYDFYDGNDNHLGKASGMFVSEGGFLGTAALRQVMFDVEKESTGYIGKLKEVFSRYYEIYSPFKEKLATVSLDFWGTTFTVSDAKTSEAIAFLYNVSNGSWTVRIVKPELFDEKGIDPLFLSLIIAAYTDKAAKAY